MRTSGMMPYITPRQIATESSTTPKSVMNTMVGGYFAAASFAALAGIGTAASSTTTIIHPIICRSPNSRLRLENEVIGFFLSFDVYSKVYHFTRVLCACIPRKRTTAAFSIPRLTTP